MTRLSSHSVRLYVRLALIALMLSVAAVAAHAQQQYKPGDIVEIDQFGVWKKATVMAVRADGVLTKMIEANGASGSVDLSTTDHIRMFQGTAAAPAAVPPARRAAVPVQARGQEAAQQPGDCPAGVPSGPLTKSSPPSQQTFERAIYETRKNDRGQFTMGFEQFQMGATSKNTVIDNGHGAERLYKDVPLGATVYTVKAIVISCNTDAHVTERRSYRMEYACMKDNFGAWTCPSTRSDRIDFRTWNH